MISKLLKWGSTILPFSEASVAGLTRKLFMKITEEHPFPFDPWHAQEEVVTSVSLKPLPDSCKSSNLYDILTPTLEANQQYN